MGTTASSTDLTVSEVTEWVGNVDERTVIELIEALRDRDAQLGQLRAAAAQVGQFTVLGDLSPEFLESLTGEILEHDGETVSVLLTPESTGRLRFSGQDVYDLGSDVEFLLEGVPAVCCFPAQSAALAMAS